MRSPQPRRALVVGAGWLAAAVVATLAGLGGIRLVGDSLTGTPGGVRSEADVERALAAAAATPAQVSPSASPPATVLPPATALPSATSGPSATRSSPSSPPATRPVQASFRSAGGTAIAGCRGGQASLTSWSPNPGYQVKDYDRGPGDDVRVRFEGSDGHVEIRIHCRAGVPTADHQSGDD